MQTNDHYFDQSQEPLTKQDKYIDQDESFPVVKKDTYQIIAMVKPSNQKKQGKNKYARYTFGKFKCMLCDPVCELKSKKKFSSHMTMQHNMPDSTYKFDTNPSDV